MCCFYCFDLYFIKYTNDFDKSAGARLFCQVKNSDLSVITIFFKFHGDHNYDVTPKAIALNIYLKCRKICVIKFRASKNFAVGVPFN